MKYQNQVVLSVGSNQGDRQSTILSSIDFIHAEIGTVIQVSNLYETPSWGFSSDLFYNVAVLIHTIKTPSQIWLLIQDIEKKLGRVRNQELGYQSRSIDIDIISFNEEVINSDELQIPHPQMQNRLFVLLPMVELGLDYVHPVLKSTLTELIQNCSDTNSYKNLGVLSYPLESLDFENFNYIAIEGNIGAGKTTLAIKIAEDFNAKTVLERFADNPFLPKFYKDQSRYAFSLEMSFLADRYQQISDDLAQFDLFKDFVIGDYHIFKSLIFAKVTVTEDEFRLYRKLFEIIYREMPKPDLYVYLYQNTERLLENIKSRGRAYEQEIPSDYLEKINQGYLDYIKSQDDLAILIIDVTTLDFVNNQSDYIYILNEIQKKINQLRSTN